MRELTRKGFAPKRSGAKHTYLWIPCPFHEDGMASFEIRTDGKWCRCFGCEWRGNWDKLAKAIGMATIFGEDDLTKHEYEIGDTLRYINQLLEDSEELNTVQLPPGAIPWTQGTYRGISETTLHEVGTYLWYDDKFQTERILWEVNVHQELRGWVSRRLDRVDIARYYNMPDVQNEEWVASSLFPFDTIKNDVVCIVEGPVDALFLAEHDIPAVAFLGGGWSRRKTALLGSLGLSRVCIIPDNDENKAGDAKALQVYEAVSNYFDTEIIRLPRRFGDAAELDEKTLRKLQKMI